MADELTPITRLEGILAGQDIQPITRLEYFLKQYADGGGSGGEGGGGEGGVVAWLEATMNMQTGALVVDMAIDDLFEAMRNGALGFVVYMELGSAWSLSRFYFQSALNQAGMKLISAASIDSADPTVYEGTENEDGKTVFEVMS